MSGMDLHFLQAGQIEKLQNQVADLKTELALLKQYCEETRRKMKRQAELKNRENDDEQS